MKTQSIIHTLTEKFSQAANVKSIFGEPIEAHGKTIIPVAKIAYGLGVGGANGLDDSDEAAPGGGGGGVAGIPAGVLEVTEDETRFIPYNDWKKSARLLGFGALLGILIYRWTR